VFSEVFDLKPTSGLYLKTRLICPPFGHHERLAPVIRPEGSAPKDGVTKLLMRSLGISGYRKIERAFAPKKGAIGLSPGFQSREHGQAFLCRGNAIDRDEAFGDRRIKAGAHSNAKPRASSKTWPWLTLPFAVSFGRVKKHRETCALKLFDQLPSMVGRPMRGIIQKRCHPGDESEFNVIDIEFFAVKKGVYPENKTPY
jgi:hypothetical protein